ncbi:MAG: hypothetical protein HYZ81_24055 [Nitrospinae bacterium]|nr:hypothetical protein [Nitrospinota bacterium]
MLTREENELVTKTDPGTPMGEAMRRYWIPALLSRELPAADCPPVMHLPRVEVRCGRHLRGSDE